MDKPTIPNQAVLGLLGARVPKFTRFIEAIQNPEKADFGFNAIYALFGTLYPTGGTSIIAKLPEATFLRTEAETAAFLADYIPRFEREANKSGPVHDAELVRELVIHQFNLVARECMAVCASVEEFEAELRFNIARFVCYSLSQYGWLADPMMEEVDEGFTLFVMYAKPWAEIPEQDRDAVWHVGMTTGEALSHAALKLRAEACARAAEGGFPQRENNRPSITGNTKPARQKPSLGAVAKDEERREKAEYNLVRALQSYINKLDNANARDAHRETEILCDYARENYAARAEPYIEAMPAMDPDVLFEVGDLTEHRDLSGLPTIGDVFELVKRVKVQRPDHWPDPSAYLSGESLQERRALGEVMGREQVSFEWLLEKPCDAWFRPQIHDCVRECVRAKREEYELRFPTAPEAESVPQAVDEPGSSEKPGNAEMIKTPALSRDQSRLTACPPRGITEGAMADSNFWKERSAEFLTDAIRFADLSADWKAYSGVWTLWWGSTLEPEGIRIPPEVLAALNETSRKAVIGLPGSSTSGNQEPWRLWLELMRKGNWRGFVHMGNCSVSEKVWEAGVKIGRPPVDVRRELQLSTFDEPEADHWLKDLRLDKVFRESAKFCDDLASVLGLAAPGAQWVTTGNPTLDQPSEKVDPDALKRPQGEVGAAQPRPATGSRDANAPSDEVISSGSGLATPCQPMETVNNSHPGPASDGGPKALDEPCASDKPRTAEMIAVPATDAEMRKERHARRDGYKSECKRHGVTVTDLMIAEAASSNWHSRTAIQKWLTCDPRYDGEPDRLIRSVFAKKPHIPPKP